MDGIDVGINSIDTTKNEYLNAVGLNKSMRFYFYISCIDTVWEGIQQLHRIFFDTNSISFENENIIFKDNIFFLKQILHVIKIKIL